MQNYNVILFIMKQHSERNGLFFYIILYILPCNSTKNIYYLAMILITPSKKILMYNLTTQPRIYFNLSDVDPIFHLDARSYEDYEKKNINTIHHFTMKVNAVENSR